MEELYRAIEKKIKDAHKREKASLIKQQPIRLSSIIYKAFHQL